VTGKPKDYADKVQVQVDFMARLLHFVDLHEPIRGVAELPEISLAELSFFTKYGFNNNNNKKTSLNTTSNP
jgi:hypothetical protein